MENIVDLNGNKRFVEGDLAVKTITDVEFTYSKWSLSGTHLMVVIAGNGKTSAVLDGEIATAVLPDYIKDKIYPTVSGSNLVDRKGMTLYGSGPSQTSTISMTKITNGLYFTASSVTLSEDKEFRIQFDLLIDAE